MIQRRTALTAFAGAGFLAALGLGGLLWPLLPTGAAEDPRPAPPRREAPKEPPPRPEADPQRAEAIEQTRAEMKELQRAMERLHQQMEEVQRRFQEAQGRLAQLAGRPNPQPGPRPDDREGPGHHRAGLPGGEQRLAELERKVDALLHEMEGLRRDLRAPGAGPRPGGSPPRQGQPGEPRPEPPPPAGERRSPPMPPAPGT